MGSFLTHPLAALPAAGVVGQWAIDGKSRTVSHDGAAALFLFGDVQLADTFLPIEKIFGLIHPEDRAAIDEDCARYLTNGGPGVVEARIACATAGERLLQMRGRFAWDEGRGGMVGRGIILDVTDFPRPPAAAPSRADTPKARTLIPASDPLAEAAARSIEVRAALGRSGHGALRLAADLLLWEINTALAERMTASDKPVSNRSERNR